MTTSKNILRIVPVMQSASIAAGAYRDYSKGKKKKGLKHVFKSTARTITGISLIAPTSSIIESMD